MIEILQVSQLIPQGQGELPDSDWLSVSINDNVLEMFADEETKLTGFSSLPRLRVRHLDPFHWAVAAADALGDPLDEQSCLWAGRLGYVDTHEEVHIDPCTFRRLVHPYHGVVFPFTQYDRHGGLHFHHHRDEAEIALNDEGCKEVWENIDCIFVEGNEYQDIAEGWEAVVCCARIRGIIDRREEKHLYKKIKTTWTQ